MSDLRTQMIRVAHSHPGRLRTALLQAIEEEDARVMLGALRLHVTGDRADELRVRLARSLNFCDMRSDLCRGNLGLPRIKMPVIEGPHMKDFLQKLSAGRLDLSSVPARPGRGWLSSGDPDRDKVRVRGVSVPVGKLKATQREINADKAQSMAEKAEKGTFDPGEVPVLMSNDYYILDGHHRWAAQLLRGAAMKLRGFMVDLPVKILLAIANAYTDAMGINRKSF